LLSILDVWAIVVVFPCLDTGEPLDHVHGGAGIGLQAGAVR
jgi:hypothetical protein